MLLPWLRERYKTILLVATPILLLPLPLVIGTMEAKAGYILLLMSTYWIFEVVPLGITALFPVLLVPLFGILPSSVICPAYFKDSNMLFLGGLVMAVSIEVWNLHKRIALRVLLLFGVQPRWLLFGFLVPTWLLSMWISNTATTAMMIPIAEAVLEELKKHFEPDSLDPETRVAGGLAGRGPSSAELLSGTEMADVTMVEAETATAEPLKAETSFSESVNPTEAVPAAESTTEKRADHAATSMKDFLADPRNHEFRGICRMMLISLAYGAVFGGVATITGTSPNVIFNGIVQEYFGSETSFNYSSWFFYALPISLVCLVLSWVWLQVSFLGVRSLIRPRRLRKEDETLIIESLRREYVKLGPISFAELECIVIFCITIALWIAREPGVPGWSSLFKETNPVTGQSVTYMSDAQPAILATILLFALPSRNPFANCFGGRRPPAVQPSDSAATQADFGFKVEQRPAQLLTWRLVQQKVSWQIVLLLGGGLAMAETSRESGLSQWISLQLNVLQTLPLPALVFLICFFSAILTELTSNSTTATIFLPILASFTERIGLHPFFLMLPSAASCSFAFNLPISTPSNIMVYSRGFLTVTDMVRTGCVMTLLSNCIVAIATLSFAPAIFNLYEFPSWARNSSATNFYA